MPVLVDCSVLVNSRSKKLVDEFLGHFMPHRRWCIPKNYDIPQLIVTPDWVLHSADEALSYLEKHPNEAYALEWSNETTGEPRFGMVRPTTDGQMILGLSFKYENENLPGQYLERMKTFLQSANGYITFEEPPARTAQEFISNGRHVVGLEKNDYFYYCLGKESLEAGKCNDAIKHFERSLAIDPHCRTYERLSLVMDRLGRNELAFDYLRKAFNLKPNNDLVAVRFAEKLLRRGDLDHGKEVLRQLLTRNSTYGPAKILLSEFK